MTLLDRVLLVLLGDEGTEPSAAGGSWGCCAGPESPRQGAAVAGASGGCSGEACLGTSVAAGALRPLRQRLAVVVPALVRLVQPEVEVLLVLRPLHRALRLALEARLLSFAASASGAFAGALQLLVTWSWDNPAAVLAVLAHSEVLLAAAAAAGDRLLPGVGRKGGSLSVPGQAA